MIASLYDGEHLVEVELAHVASRLASRSARRPRRAVRKPASGDDRRADVAGLRVVAAPVEEEEAEVGERVAERRHLPVEHRDDAAGIVGREHRVVEAVVAVHDRRRRRRRERGAQPARELVDAGQLARLRPFPLLAPAPHLAFDVAVGMAEVAEPDRVVVDRVDRDEHVDELFGAPAGVVGRERRESAGVRRIAPSTFSIT